MTASSTPRLPRKPRRSMADDVRENKREEILAAAEALFFERGYAQTTVADIVAATPASPTRIATASSR